jgi:hypothetical protein
MPLLLNILLIACMAQSIIYLFLAAIAVQNERWRRRHEEEKQPMRKCGCEYDCNEKAGPSEQGEDEMKDDDKERHTDANILPHPLWLVLFLFTVLFCVMFSNIATQNEWGDLWEGWVPGIIGFGSWSGFMGWFCDTGLAKGVI